MDGHDAIKIAVGAVSAFLLLLLLLIFVICCVRRWWRKAEALEMGMRMCDYADELETEDLMRFEGGEDLTVHDILEAPGEVVGKSGYGTLYMASLERRRDCVVLLRFLRPACTERTVEMVPAIRMLGLVRHPNLVPLRAFYSGPRGEKLLVHPFYFGCNLSQFLRDASNESHRWPIVYKISLGIAEGLDYLHNGLQKPIIHGNLKSKNVLLDSNHQPYLSDFGLHLLLNPAVSQEVLEASADQGYKAPELIKMKDASKESDVYSLGVILLEVLSRKEPVYRSSSSPLDIYLPTSMRNAALEHKVTEMFNFEILSQSNRQTSITEEGLLMYFQLAMSCCSPSPSLRPDTKQIIRKLGEIGQQ